MPDGRPATGPDYDDDFYAWTQRQAAVLRSLETTDNRFDRDHVAEEIEDLGKSERDAVRSQVRRIVEHLLKLEYSPAVEPRHGWIESLIEGRQTLVDKITPTLRHEIETELERLYRDGRKRAAAAMTHHNETEAVKLLPVACPYTFDKVCEEDWYPDQVEIP